MTISKENRHYLVVELGIGSAIIDFLINGAIAWLILLKAGGTMPLWGETSIGGDTIATAFLLPYITFYIIAALVRRRVAAGKLVPITRTSSSGIIGFLSSCSRHLVALIFGIAAILLVALPVVYGFNLMGLTEISRKSFFWYKAIFAALLGLVTAPAAGFLLLVSSAPPAETE